MSSRYRLNELIFEHDEVICSVYCIISNKITRPLSKLPVQRKEVLIQSLPQWVCDDSLRLSSPLAALHSTLHLRYQVQVPGCQCHGTTVRLAYW